MPAGRPRSDRQLPECRQAGLSCRECVAAAAGHVAAIGSGLNSSLVRQLFFLMYPETACAPMAGEFVQIVNAAGERPVGAAAAEARERCCAAVA